MLADAPVDDDLTDRFGYGDIADGLARLIEGEETAGPADDRGERPVGSRQDLAHEAGREPHRAAADQPG
jgi:hypothetical protein